MAAIAHLFRRLIGLVSTASAPPPPPPTPAAAGRRLAKEAAAKARADRSARVWAHIAALRADLAREAAERARHRAATGLPLFTGEPQQ